MHETSAKLVISIWRDFQPKVPLVLNPNDGSQPILLHSGSGLQEEIYSWQTKEDCFGCIGDEQVRAKLHAGLVTAFEASKPPQERRVELLRSFLEAASAAISSADAEWIASADAPGVDDEDTPVMINPLQALALHLSWLYEVFSRQPGVSILVR